MTRAGVVVRSRGVVRLQALVPVTREEPELASLDFRLGDVEISGAHSIPEGVGRVHRFRLGAARVKVGLRRGAFSLRARGVDTTSLAGAESVPVDVGFDGASHAGQVAFRGAGATRRYRGGRDAPPAADGPVTLRELLRTSSDGPAPFVVVRTREAWDDFWEQHARGTEQPAVDFSQEMVVGVFFGGGTPARSCAGVTSVSLDADALRIEAKDRFAPYSGGPVLQSWSAPAQVFAVPRTDREVLVRIHAETGDGCDLE